MTASARVAVRFLVGSLTAIVCSCLPTDTGTNLPPSLSAATGTTVFVGEPIDFYVRASDAEGNRITFSLPHPPSNATIDASTGLFSWRPAFSDTGVSVVIFVASDGAHTSADTATFAVVNPTMGTGLGVRILRPAPGDTTTYRYGDTLTVAFAITWCADQPVMTFYPKEGGQSRCIFVQNNTGGNSLSRTQTDSLDNAGRTCKFVRLYQDQGYWVGFYRLPLVNSTTVGSACALDFGGGVAPKDSLRIKVEDVYGFDRCGMSNPGAVSEVTSGRYSGYFSVVPHQ